MEKVFKERFGERLKERRRHCGYSSCGKLAAQIGITPQSLNNYENGNTTPDVETLCKLAAALDCTVDYLALKEDAPTHEAASIADMTGLNAGTVNKLLDIYEKSENADGTAAARRARLALDSIDSYIRFADIEEIGQRFMSYGDSLVKLIDYVYSCHKAEFEAIKDSRDKIVEKWNDTDSIQIDEYDKRMALESVVLGQRYAFIKSIEERFLDPLQGYFITTPEAWGDEEADNGKGEE